MTVTPSPRNMPRAEFVARFAHVFEHSPWIPEAAYDAGLPDDADTADGLHRALCAVLWAASPELKRTLIDAHPDLAGRLAKAGTLTADSSKEQTSAGLDRLDAAEYERFKRLNAAYRKKFEFPFILAIKGRTKDEILRTFAQRLENDPDAEHAEALAQIERIALLRLKDILP